MPALYRMPVFYLIVLLGLGAFAAGYRPPAPEAVEAPEVVVPIPKVAEGTVEVEGGATSDGILRTPEGLRRKVVVKDLAVACRTDPGGGKSAGPPLDYFAIRYLYDVAPADRPVQLLVGPRGGPPQGWVPAASVLEWDTRLMARPTPRAGRPPLVIYRDEGCLVARLDGHACPIHGDGCPTEGEEPSAPLGSAGADGAPEGGRPPLGFPILRSKAVGDRTLFEVASLVQDRAPGPILPPEPPADLRPYLKVVDVAFAIDTTASMQGTIEAARKLAAGLVEATSKRYSDVSLRFALVEYRDASPHYGFRARKVASFTDAEGFLTALNRINAATRGDGSVAERVLDGVALALPADGPGPTADHVDWPTGRAGDLATKLLVVLGDAPDHDRDLVRARALAALAKRSGITIATVAIDRPGSLSRDESARYHDQWRVLAEESSRPLDKGAGFASPVPPLTFELQGGEALADRLQGLIDDRIEHARTIAAMATAEAEGKLGEYVDSRGLTLDRVAPVLVDLHRGDTARVARLDPRADGRKAPSVRRGWVAERLGGRAMVSVEMLMSREELTALIDELARLQQAASGGARDLAELLQVGTAAAVGETSFLAADRGSRTFADHLRSRQGLPPPRADSLLRRSQADLLRADDLSLAALDAKLRASLLTLTRRAQDPDWTDARRTAEGMALVPYDAIDF